MHFALLATLAATLTFTSIDPPAAKLHGALVAAGGAEKAAARWELLRLLLPCLVSAGAACIWFFHLQRPAQSNLSR